MVLNDLGIVPYVDSFRVFNRTKGILISWEMDENPYDLIGKSEKQGIIKRFFKGKEKEHTFEKLMSFNKFINF